MAYDKIFARSFSRYEQKRLGCGALVGFFLIVLSICTVFKPYLDPLQVLNLRSSMGGGLKMLMIMDTSHSQPIENRQHAKTEDLSGLKIEAGENSTINENKQQRNTEDLSGLKIAYVHGEDGENSTINENKQHTNTGDLSGLKIAYVHGEDGENSTINENKQQTNTQDLSGLKIAYVHRDDGENSTINENKQQTNTKDLSGLKIAYVHRDDGENSTINENKQHPKTKDLSGLKITENSTVNENKQHTKTEDLSGSNIASAHGGEAEKSTINETVRNKIMEPVCNFTAPRSDFCEASGDIRVHGGSSSTIHIASSPTMGILEGNSSWEIRPYARKTDATAMGVIRKWSVKKSITTLQTDTIPGCTVNHRIPAILFSVGGYAGNHFHAFTDVVIPLFLTSRPFNGEVQFLVTDQSSWWINKFRVLLTKLSNYEVIDIDKDEHIHCFPRIIVGLKSHKELNMDPSKPPYYSMDDFRVFLRSSYSLNRTTAIKLRDDGHEGRKPRLLIISRRRTRAFTNEKKIVRMARRSGFEVVVEEADTRTSLSKFAGVVNSCDAVMGVHGAGLTNIVFLPDNAIFIQIVPLGKMELLSRYDFGDPAKDMKLRYLEYSIKQSESTLIQQYPPDHAVFKNPNSIKGQGWLPFRSIYLDKQNVKLDVKRFRPILLKALELLHDDQKAL